MSNVKTIGTAWHAAHLGSHPPFNTPILAVVESSLDNGRGFKPHQTVVHLRVLQADADGDEDVGAEMAEEISDGTVAWRDQQFLLQQDEGEDLHYYSDSITWWCVPPTLPLDDGNDT